MPPSLVFGAQKKPGCDRVNDNLLSRAAYAVLMPLGDLPLTVASVLYVN